jgi:hypothetical protein
MQTITHFSFGLCFLSSWFADDGECSADYIQYCAYEEAAYDHGADCGEDNDEGAHIAYPCGCALSMAAPTTIRMPQTKPTIVRMANNSYEPP